MTDSRPASAPDFLLSRASGSLRTQGSASTFSDVDEAMWALAHAKVDLVVGALPFRFDDPAALTVPKHAIFSAGPLEPHAYYRTGEGSKLSAQVLREVPSVAVHEERVAALIRTIANTAVEKVVLARAIDIAFDPPVDPLTVAAKLIDLSASLDGFAVDLTPAGERFAGSMLVGSSPEVLLKKQGATVTAFPLAGSLPRGRTPEEDAANKEALHNSAKDIAEHRFVVDALVDTLGPLCEQIDYPQRPEITATAEMWHLATPITATLRSADITALDLAVRCHPTPAVCGTPQALAYDLINTIEQPRNFYGGAVGWSDKDGNGEFMVAIRCAEVAADGNSARAWAGGGIVAESHAADEVQETSAKLRTIARALQIDVGPTTS
ncbi:isochorismate synthase MenF [Corynebacterium choanae]|nr:isochorismate synthase [Corynebacterium choanae]